MKEYQLNVDPRILELLGPNLYTNIYYVLAELIANAYDADAKNVYIIANPDDIRIEDDGHGMSYEKGDITKYLNIAGVSRVKETDSFSKSGTRRKMGRKGVGKLAALSVSENVDILTVADGEKSGFVLSRHPDEGSKLKPISESDIKFEHVKNHGSAIVMRNPQYRLHKTLSAVKRNLLKIFPLVNADFRIHVVRGKETVLVDNFDTNVMSELGTLITLGDEYSPLINLVPDPYPHKRPDLVSSIDEKTIPRVMMGNDGVEHEYTIKIAGWIGTYRTTRGRKAEISDFPDNFISLFANKKMGEFNILPVVGQNKLNEVYVVGQLHVDIFELTELPDMALSNRQGYKSDDPRYLAVLDYVRKELLTEILKKREVFTDTANAGKKRRKQEEQKGNEEKLRQNIDAFRKRASEEAADDLLNQGSDLSREAIEKAISNSFNKNSPNLGLKSVVDAQKKKILISQTAADKTFADIIYQMLIFNNAIADEILYTNCDDEVCRVPEGKGVYEYLRDFFVESYSAQKIFVLFVTSENTKMSWGAITEIGASWITQVDHKIFNVHPFKPEHPLNNDLQWQNTNREEATKGELWMLPLNADVFCQKIEAVCDAFGYKKNSRAVNKAHLGTIISIRNS
ncbi:ATP-binding protein [Pseudomonas syringae pv. atrofaciens]|uniref:ATP-binding protein n=2 Tax=Pseudomonas syringae TaxID=317 RepID=A0AAD0IED4_PSESX|nr:MULTISPECIES: ATP-binding protein [Pseudomonas syringae group]AVX26970.1 ATP-binding protein [Pseudomonas syringae pv. atrofaciens]PCK90177.1 ATP-binding protein [Pseudomonas viridiflava]